MDPKARPIIVLGGGPAGLAASYILQKQGSAVTVVERDHTVGGLAKSFTHDGYILDFGPHRFFTKLEPVLQLWREVLAEDRVTVNRLTRIYYGGKYFNYPLKIKEVLLTLGIGESLRMVISYLQATLLPNSNPRNFAEWVTARFGKRLFQIFFEGYTEKLWGIPCTEISADWAAQRIKGLSLGRAIRNALLGNDGKVKSLVEQFEFPKLGSGQLYEKIATHLGEHHHQVLLNCEVLRVNHENQRIVNVVLRDRQTGKEWEEQLESAISSIPLSLLILQMHPAPPAAVISAAKSLRFRNTVLVYLFVEGENLFPDNWLYINEPAVQLGRVTNFANWSPFMLPGKAETPLCCEYWCDPDDQMWQAPEADLIAMAEADLRQIRLIKSEKIRSGLVLRLSKTYPIYTGDYKEALATIRQYLSQFENLQVIGRYGAFKYNNQDHSLLMGIMAAENIQQPGKHDLWDVNSDSEYAEEVKTVKPPKSSKFSILLGEFARYLFVGGLATIIDALFYNALVGSGMWYKFALAISFAVGLSTNFILSRRFVFMVYWENWLVQYLVFSIVALTGLLANYGVMGILIDDLHWDSKNILTRLVSAACVVLISFTGHKLHSFADRDLRAKLAKA